MHEYSIAQGIVRAVEKELAARAVTAAVEKVVIRAGKLNAIVPDSLSFHFDIAKRDSVLLRECVLEIVAPPLVVSCTSCANQWEAEEAVFECSRCGGPVLLTGGKELQLESIVVEDG